MRIPGKGDREQALANIAAVPPPATRDPLRVYEVVRQQLRRAGGPIEIQPFGHHEDRKRGRIAARISRFAPPCCTDQQLSEVSPARPLFMGGERTLAAPARACGSATRQ